jgi:hypothetical protein
MTTSQEYYNSEGYVEDAPQTYEGAAYLEQPIPVVSLTENYAPEFGGCMTWPLPVQGTNPPIQILSRRTRRHKGKIEINFTVPGTVILNSRLDALSNGQGYVVAVPVAGLYSFHDWESQQPLYAVASVAGITAMVLDESYAER